MSTIESQFAESVKDIGKYKGQWIAILDNKIIANGESIVELHKKISSQTVRTPLFLRIPEKGDLEKFIL